MVSANRFNQEVSDIVAQLVRLYRPQKIILFGSLAKGQITDGTDIDLFVVKSDLPNWV